MKLKFAWRSARGRHCGLLLALLCALIACVPLVGPGIINTRAGGDSPFLLQRLHQLVGMLRAGEFPVRWMPDAAYGLGYPFFNFYASLPYYIAAVLSLLGGGYTAALKLTQMAGMLAASAAMYGFVRRATRDEMAALLSAAAYTYAPFHLVNVYVRGDSLSEFWAFVFYPLVFWALVSLRDRPSVRKLVVLALAYGCLVLTHNISAMIFTPFVVLYALTLLLSQRENRFRFLILGLAAGVLGGAISAWFWVPAALEQPYVQLQEMATGYFHFSEHFRWADLVQWKPLFDYAIDGQRTPFSMSIGQVLLAAGGVGVALIRLWKRREREIQSGVACLILLIATWMVTPWSRVVWENVPLLPLAQFPWRFLSVQAFGAAWVGGLLVARLSERSRWIPVALASLLGVLALGGLQPERLYVRDSEVTRDRLMLYEVFTGNIGTTVRHEYLPYWVVPRPYTSMYHASGENTSEVLVLQGEVSEAVLLSGDPTSQRWAVDVLSPEAALAFRTHYYPGWQAAVDGKRVELEAAEGTGFLRVLVSQGKHEVELSFGRTPGRVAAECLSVAAVLLIALLLRPRGRMMRYSAAVTSVALVLALGFQVGTILPSRMGGNDDLTMDFNRVPYLHHNSDGVRFGKDLKLLSYTFSSDSVNAGDSVDVALRWEGRVDSSKRVRLRVLGVTEHLFGVSYPYSESVESLSSTHMVLRLAVPADVPPGEYLLALALLGEEGEIRPESPRGETLGTLYLRPIRVVEGGQWGADETSLGDFGPGIALARAQSEQVEQGKLRVQLTWRCREVLDRRYAMSLRLRDSRGKVVASRDLPPFFGAYPTSIWQPGDEVTDRQSLPLPEGTAPGTGYDLEVILYDVPSLAPIGSAIVPHVSVTIPTVRPVNRVDYQYDAELALKKMETSLDGVEPGASISVRIMWWAVDAPARRYACRLALVDADGEVVALSGKLSLTPEYPTSTWPQHALIWERYSLPTYVDTLPGVYTLVVELVDAETDEAFGVYVSSSQVSVQNPQ